MSNVKISELPVATLPLTGAEELPIVQAGVTNKVSVSNLSSATKINNFTGNGATVAFTLLASPANENATNVYVNGVYQQKNTYTVSGTTLTFSQAPPTTSTIEVSYL